MTYNKNKTGEKNNKMGQVGLVISILLFFFVLILLSKSGKDVNIGYIELDNSIAVVEQSSNGQENLIVNDKFTDINNLLDSGDFKGVISIYEKKGIGNLDRGEKIKLVSGYLGYGNYFYKEEEYSKKAMDILETMDDEYVTLYYKGYVKEIIKDYTESLKYYNSGLELKDLTDIERAVLLNQKGHLYDIKGDFEKALPLYEEAYKFDNNNVQVLSNLGRFYARKGEYMKAIYYFELTLSKIYSLPKKSEIYFTLSSIELEIGGLSPDIDKSIEYAKKSIETYSSYPMGYLALARGLYMKNDSTNDKEIKENLDKSIELNPNGYYAYELYGLHEYDKGNMDKFLEIFINAESVIDNDMILMDNQRSTEKTTLNFKYYILSEIQRYKENKEDGLFKEGFFTFLDSLVAMPAGKKLLTQQFQRKGYGILGFLSGEEELEVLIEKLN
ncbi:MAG: tetratricopeptide repeat protein [Candidatus Gracilibacteria bacterium]